MPKIATKPLTRLHVRLFAEDHQYLKDNYGGDNEISGVIRNVLHSFLIFKRQQLATKYREINSEDIGEWLDTL